MLIKYLKHIPRFNMHETKWNKIPCKISELKLKETLSGGQSFRWSVNDNKQEWTGVFNGKVWILNQDENNILYKVFDVKIQDDYDEILLNYFRLDLNLEEYYNKWCLSDPFFEKVAKDFYGIRMLNQELVETIFAFICSSNNNIARITSLVEKLALHYGEKICTIDGTDHYAFPTVEMLAQEGVEGNLRKYGFGYRSKYIAKSADYIVKNGGDEWLESLKAMDYAEAKKNLMLLSGIGAKVADCICLMALGHLQAIPVDTHIYQIVSRLYMKKLPKTKTVTPEVYNSIGDHFRNLYGPLAGWAQTILFCADLKKFQN